jgi:hypothetical protein
MSDTIKTAKLFTLLSKAETMMQNVPAVKKYAFVQSVKQCGWCTAYDEDLGPQPLIHKDDCELIAWLNELKNIREE